MELEQKDVEAIGRLYILLWVEIADTPEFAECRTVETGGGVADPISKIDGLHNLVALIRRRQPSDQEDVVVLAYQIMDDLGTLDFENDVNPV